MKKSDLKKEFIKFLKEKGLFVEFCVGLANPKWHCESICHNLKGCLYLPNGMSLSTYLNKVHPFDWVFEAFLWEKAIWSDINSEWNKRLNSLR